MTLAIYIKETPKHQSSPWPAPKNIKNRDRFFFSFISLVGAVSIIFAVGPLLIWQFVTVQKLSSEIEKVPIPQGQVLSASTFLSQNVQVLEEADGFSYFTTDYKPTVPRPKEFTVTIPKLKINKARTLVDSLKFDTNLSHFPGSAIPGEVGNTFITGHSVLPQFNDPKDYKAIFTKLSDLEIGDQVYVEIEGKKLQFAVQYAKIVDPRDVSVLSPISPNGRNLTLMTCVPPGTSTKRLVVVTSLI